MYKPSKMKRQNNNFCCKLRVMNDHIDGHYELHLLIFKMSNGSSYYEAYKRLLTPHVRASREKEESSSSHYLSLSLSFTFSILFFDSFFHIIYQSKIYFISTTLICIIFVLVLQQF